MNKFLLLLLAITCSVAACNDNKSGEDDATTTARMAFASPEAGTMVSLGDSIDVRLGANEEIDSVIYLLEEVVVGKETSGAGLRIPTAGHTLGSKLITAKWYRDGQEAVVNSNIVLVASQAPAQWSFSVMNTYPHDREAYTQGLEYQNGYLYESTGQTGKSSLRKVEPKTGKVVQKHELDDKYFGEGLTIVGDKIVQLTWEQGIGFVYDKASFTPEREFTYQASAEGWGLCFDGNRLIKSDGTNSLYFLNKETFREEGAIEVYNHRGAVHYINELEYIDGKIFANIYKTDLIVVIDPLTGEVVAELDMTGLLPKSDYNNNTDVLNGIAYNKATNTIYVTGKNWPKLFEIKLLD